MLEIYFLLLKLIFTFFKNIVNYFVLFVIVSTNIIRSSFVFYLAICRTWITSEIPELGSEQSMFISTRPKVGTLT